MFVIHLWLVNQCYKVLRNNGKLIFKLPHWSSSRAYGDLLVQTNGIIVNINNNVQTFESDLRAVELYKCIFDFFK